MLHTVVKYFYKGIWTLPLELMWRSVIRLCWFIETKALHNNDPNHSSGTCLRFWVNFIKRNMKTFLLSILLKSTHLTLKVNSPTRQRPRGVSDISIGSYTINASSWASKTPGNLKHVITFFLCVSQKLALAFPHHCRSNQYKSPAFLISSLCMKLPSL